MTKINRVSTSFEEALTKTYLPVVPIEVDGKSFNFLIDTGSDNSFIHKPVEAEISSKELIGYQGGITGATGSSDAKTPVYGIVFTCGTKELADKFTVSDFTGVFTYLERTSGVQLHGILGSKFLTKYGAILDFEAKIFFI